MSIQFSMKILSGTLSSIFVPPSIFQNLFLKFDGSLFFTRICKKENKFPRIMTQQKPTQCAFLFTGVSNIRQNCFLYDHVYEALIQFPLVRAEDGKTDRQTSNGQRNIQLKERGTTNYPTYNCNCIHIGRLCIKRIVLSASPREKGDDCFVC